MTYRRVLSTCMSSLLNQLHYSYGKRLFYPCHDIHKCGSPNPHMLSSLITNNHMKNQKMIIPLDKFMGIMQTHLGL